MQGCERTSEQLTVASNDRDGVIAKTGISEPGIEIPEGTEIAPEILKTIFESLPYPFYVVDTNDYSIKLANRATSVVFGSLSKDTTCYALTHNRSKPCDSSEHRCPIKELKKSKKPVVVEHIHYDAEDKVRNYEIHAFPIFDRRGNVVQMLEFSLDVTDRKRVENALKESEKKYRYLAKASLEGILLHENGAILEANDAMQGILGLTPEEVLGKEIFDFVSPESVDVVRANIRTNYEEPYEVVLVRNDGRRVDVEIHAKSFFYQGRNVWIAAIRDITDRKRIEKEVKEQRELLLKIFEQVPIGIAVLRNDGSFFFWNSALERMTGYYRKEFRQLCCEDLVYEKEKENFRAGFSDPMKKNWKNYKLQTKIIKKNGKILTVEIHTYRILDTISDEPLYVCFLNDLSQTQERERKHKSLIHKLRRLHSELGEFTETFNESDRVERGYDRPDYGMSKFDDNIIELIIQGYRNREIAEALHVAEITVKKRISNIYRKVGVKRRLELIELLRSSINV